MHMHCHSAAGAPLMRGVGRAVTPLLIVALAVLSVPVAANEDLWTLLEAGGQVVLIRHGLTTPGVGDPPGMRLDDCSTQRNLIDTGRQEARRVGKAFRARGIPVGRVLSSPWCRCVETAQLAFGTRPETWLALSNLFGRQEAAAEQVRDLRARVSERPADGNLVLVTHGSTIAALTGINPGTAEMVVVTPRGGGRFAVAGRLSAR